MACLALTNGTLEEAHLSQKEIHAYTHIYTPCEAFAVTSCFPTVFPTITPHRSARSKSTARLRPLSLDQALLSLLADTQDNKRPTLDTRRPQTISTESTISSNSASRSPGIQALYPAPAVLVRHRLSFHRLGSSHHTPAASRGRRGPAVKHCEPISSSPSSPLLPVMTCWVLRPLGRLHPAAGAGLHDPASHKTGPWYDV